jgi:hypothetical protein
VNVISLAPFLKTRKQQAGPASTCAENRSTTAAAPETDNGSDPTPATTQGQRLHLSAHLSA